MAKRSEYTINGPPPPGASPSQLHKSLTIRREGKGAASDLRALYRHSADFTDASPLVESKAVPNGVPTIPNLPPTPPVANGDTSESSAEEPQSEAAVFRSTLVTPTNQNSPPTPDNTPPKPAQHLGFRPWLGTQPSFASTRAESFKTAREEITSDDDSIVLGRRQRYAPGSSASLSGHQLGCHSEPRSLRSPLVIPNEQPRSVINGSDSMNEEQIMRQQAYVEVVDRELRVPQDDDLDARASNFVVAEAARDMELGQPGIEHRKDERHVKDDVPLKDLKNVALRRGPSLRDRLKVAQRNSPSASVEKFASIIGWNNNVSQEPTPRIRLEQQSVPLSEESKRLSGLSTSSTVGAMVVDTSPLPRRRTTLRKVQKNDSLRCASSPLPASNRNSYTQGDSPHRLIHKKVRLSNENRHSFGSEPSRSHSLSSSAMIPKPEVIKVAVIPARSSSLHSSANSSKRHSLSTNSARTQSKKPSDGVPPSSWQRKRTLSEPDRGREKEQTLVVPPRRSSLSAPTSRSTSRANSITSESLRVRRQEAETDLRKTLDRMESERLISSLRGSQFETSPVETPSKAPQAKATRPADAGRQKSLTPGTSEWAALRPPSTLETPFSLPSYQSASPEINEATAISFFPHHNQSLQLIEPNMMQESRAVREVRKQAYAKDETSSPLRNPRQPPEPPQFQVIPPSPGDELNNQLTGDQPTRGGSTRRRPSQRRSESFVKSLTRGLSLKNAKNRKADQELDGSLYPMWKPRAFWDDVEPRSHSIAADRSLKSTGPINNSLGLPQERTVITGPMSLVRRISERRRQNRALVKQSSHNSLQRLHATRQLYKAPFLGINVRFLGLQGLQDRLLYAQQRKEDERRERKRAALRESIGANVIAQGDSRFPASNSSLVRT